MMYDYVIAVASNVFFSMVTSDGGMAGIPDEHSREVLNWIRMQMGKWVWVWSFTCWRFIIDIIADDVG